MTTVPLYTYKLLNSQNQLEIGLFNHLAQQIRMIFIFNIEFFGTFLKKYTGQVKREYDWQDLTILISPVRNNFIKNQFTAKSRECL